MNGSTNFEIMQGMYCVSQDNWGKRRLLHEGLGFVIRHLHSHLVRLSLLVDPVQLVVLPRYLTAHVVRHVPQVSNHRTHLVWKEHVTVSADSLLSSKRRLTVMKMVKS